MNYERETMDWRRQETLTLPQHDYPAFTDAMAGKSAIIMMTNHDDFFSEFPPVGKEEWLWQIAKDLKGKQLEALDWQIGDDLSITPFAHADDFVEPPAPFFSEPNDWEICEEVLVKDVLAANRQSLEALEGGVEGLQFVLEENLDSIAFERLFAGVHIDFIGLHFAGPGLEQNPGAVLGNLERLAKQKNIPTEKLLISLGYAPASKTGIVDWRYLVDLVHFAKEKFPQSRLVTVPIPSSVEGLAAALKNGNLYLKMFAARGLSVADVADTIQFSIAVGKSYFYEIARVRAFKLLWLNVLKAWGAPLRYPVVEARFQPEAYSDELYTNMIRATTMAMSAVLGGADRLTVLPYDAGRGAVATYSPAFSRRIARNVQHLLKMESFLSEIPDAAAGSYQIENLTRLLAGKAWEAFGRPMG